MPRIRVLWPPPQFRLQPLHSVQTFQLQSMPHTGSFVQPVIAFPIFILPWSHFDEQGLASDIAISQPFPFIDLSRWIVRPLICWPLLHVSVHNVHSFHSETRQSIVRSQGCIMQWPTWTRFSGHSLPSFSGYLCTCRCRCFIPIPQVRSHALHCAHSEIAQGTATSSQAWVSTFSPSIFEQAIPPTFATTLRSRKRWFRPVQVALHEPHSDQPHFVGTFPQFVLHSRSS